MKDTKHSSLGDLVLTLLLVAALSVALGAAGLLDGQDISPSPALADAQHAARLQAQAERAARKACKLGRPLYSEDSSFSCQLAQVASR